LMVMPPADRTRFRLLADLPLEVAFKSLADRLAIVQVPVSGMWQLRASWSGGYWLCAYRESEEALRKAVYGEGLELGRATVPHAVFERLVELGRAEVVG
jgi:hypothetical protein